jgi:hypothetical protein
VGLRGAKLMDEHLNMPEIVPDLQLIRGADSAMQLNSSLRHQSSLTAME